MNYHILILTIKEPFLSKTQIRLCYHQNDSFKLSVSTIMFITYLFPYELINVYTITSTPFNTKPQILFTSFPSPFRKSVLPFGDSDIFNLLLLIQKKNRGSPLCCASLHYKQSSCQFQ